MWRLMKNITECARSVVMLDGEISNYVDILQGVVQESTLSRYHPIYSRYILMT